MPRFPHRSLLAFGAAAVMVGQALLLGAPAALADGSKEDKMKERESINQQLEDLRIELDGVNEDLAQTYLDLAETEMKIPQAQQDLEDARAEQKEAEDEDARVGRRLGDAEAEEKRLSGEVSSGQEEVDASDKELAQVAISAYKGGGPPSPASVFVGSSSPQDTVDRSMNYRLTLESQGTRLGQLRTDQAVNVNAEDRLIAVREEIKDLKQEAEEALQRKKDATQAAQDAKDDLDKLYDDQKQQKDDLEAKRSKYQGDQDNLESRGSELDEEIETLAREERARLAQSNNNDNNNAADPEVDEEASNSGGFVRPVPGRVSSRFGWRFHPVFHTRKFHSGIDFPVACGVPVKSTASGRVLQNTSNSRAGKKVIVSHGIRNGKLITSSYHHLQGYAASPGQKVSAGTTVGYVGTTGSSTGCHLHFEIHEDGTAVNPLKYV
ncbi:murein hydrolase activator EnvC family protein [Brachybacterium timonense]|uniref:murein hydrolase activator EnvC family protein n=1 Tax=Brachybacterium timonense TaxID=2050896 RepID=UPI000D0B326E|nr:M23 family metallopeptidase [Brachybacterium timonense]